MKSLSGEKVLISTSSFSAHDTAPLERLKRTGCEIMLNPHKRRLSKPETIELLAGGVTGLIAGLEPLDREVLEKATVKVISRCGSGLSNVDMKAAQDLKIAVCSTPNAPSRSVAELTIGALLSLLRMIPSMDRDLHEGKWTKKVGFELSGKTVAIIGYGRIGRKVASLLGAFEADCLAVDPYEQDTDGAAEMVSLEAALSRADIITVHASGEREIIGKREFASMKRGVFILNAARGGIIDERELSRALDEGIVRGAWLDTFGQEPYHGPLKGYSQVILTPHIGSYTAECRSSMEMEAVQNLIDAMGDRS